MDNVKDTRWIVALEEDPATGELFFTLPPTLLEELGWQIGDTLQWNVGRDDDSVSLTKNS
jgi:hypothetical protein